MLIGAEIFDSAPLLFHYCANANLIYNLRLATLLIGAQIMT